MSTEAKLAVILDLAKPSLDGGKRPMQSLATLTKLRNEMAHGKTVSIYFPDDTTFNSNTHHPKWLNAINDCDENRLHEDVVAFVTEVYNTLGFNADHPMPFGLMRVTKHTP